MTNWNPVERQLRSWKPRNPSARLRASLFGDSEEGSPASPGFNGQWGWLAPVMGCFLAMLVVSGSRNGQLGAYSVSSPTNWLAAVASNQSYAAYIAGTFHSDQNAVKTDPIAWTNGTRRSGEVRTFPLGKTNSLIY